MCVCTARVSVKSPKDPRSARDSDGGRVGRGLGIHYEKEEPVMVF